MWTKTLCLFVSIGAALAQTESKVVQLEQGQVRGYKDESGDVFRFINVPYATAPTGVHKYKAPLPPPFWTDPFDAVDRQITCPQNIDDAIAASLTIQEDCLIANIFVPDTNDTNLPVMVAVHGGGYLMGQGNFFYYVSLVRTMKAIVVTFNYRLGAHGFLCLGTEDIPGNAAMKDQVALLRWVNKNIASFGGNPDDVTVSGCSAGGGSLDFLTLSPMTAGLFKRAITESGSVFGVTGTQIDPIENAKLYAKYLNFTNVDDLTALEEFYKTASYELLVSGSEFIESALDNKIYFVPCVERETGDERFLHDTPQNILLNGNYTKVPLLYGWAEMEGLMRLPTFDYFKDGMNNKFSDFLPGELQFESDVQKEQVAESVKQFYFGDQDVNEETVLAYVDYFTDVMFAYPMLRAANMRRESLGDIIYLYEYNFVDENTPTILNTNVRGPDHCDQFFAVLDEDVTNASEEYKAMKETMRELWINFITTGNPTPEGSSLPSWPAVDGFVSPFMSLNATSRVEHSPLLGDRVRFWDAIFEEHYRAPLPPLGVPTPEPQPDSDSATKSAVSFVLLAAVLAINYIDI